MTLENIIKQYDFNLEYAKSLVQDIPEEKMTFVPSDGFENHPAFALGHLVSASALLAEDLGAKFEMPDNWAELFLRKGPGDPRKPDTDKSKYPSKYLLLKELEGQHNKVKRILNGIESSKLTETVKWRFDMYMPTLLDLVIFMCISHEAMHLGQLAAWRRALRLTSALNTL